MTQGRKPKPTIQKERLGNPGKRKLNTNEPKLDPRLPTCPSFITGEARKEWHRIGKLLVAMRVLTEADRAALAMYCQLYGRWVETEEMIAKTGAVVRGSTGQPVMNPYIRINNATIGQLNSIMAELGLTPASRSKVQATTGGEESLAEALFSKALGESDDDDE